jgi:hypothetical protein
MFLRLLVPVFSFAWLLCSSVLVSASEEDWNGVVRADEKDVPYGKHTILEADVVDLEFLIEPTKVEQSINWKSPDTNQLSQQVGLGSGLRIGTASSLNHEILFGANQRIIAYDPVFNQQRSQEFKQSQITKFQTNPTDSTALSLINEFTEEQVNEQTRMKQFWKQVVSFNYRLFPGFNFKPEYGYEKFNNDLSQVTKRESAFITLQKELSSDRLSLQIQPGFVREDQEYLGGLISEAGRFDLGLAWKPDPQTEWLFGATTQETRRISEMSQEQVHGLYSQINYSLWSDLALRLRGELKKAEKMQDGYGLSQDEADMNLKFGPNMRLNDSVSAGAELGYRHRQDYLNRIESTEQTLSLSVKGTF